MVVDGWPTLSALTEATFAHLGQAADWWDRIGPQAEAAFDEVTSEVAAPGGAEWAGVAADRAAHRASMDVVQVRGVITGWQHAAVIARRGEAALAAGQCEALEAVDAAHRDGFAVGEDYSVSDSRTAVTGDQYERRLKQATAHADYIRHRVGMLVDNERRLNADLRTATAGWGDLKFDESPHGADDRKHIQLVDHMAPRGPVVWCMRPGTAGKYLCHVLYPDLAVDQYWSFTDDSGGYR